MLLIGVNRSPMVRASASKTGGVAPFNLDVLWPAGVFKRPALVDAHATVSDRLHIRACLRDDWVNHQPCLAAALRAVHDDDAHAEA